MEYILNNGKRLTTGNRGMYKAKFEWKDETILQVGTEIYITIKDGNFTVDELPF